MLTGIRIRMALLALQSNRQMNFVAIRNRLFRRVLRKKRKPNQHQRNETRHL